MKQLASLSLALLLSMTLVACGGSGGSDTSSTASLPPASAEVLHAARAYYRTVLDGNPSASCALMSARGRAETSEFFGTGHGCAAALRELETGVSPQQEAEAREVWEELNSPAVKVGIVGPLPRSKSPRNG